MVLPKNEVDKMLEKIDQGDSAAVRSDAKGFLKFAERIRALRREQLIDDAVAMEFQRRMLDKFLEQP
jgi:hypothetical protein